MLSAWDYCSRLLTPFNSPNDNFLAQLQIFHKASCVVSKHDKATRMFYLERMVKGIVSKYIHFANPRLPLMSTLRRRFYTG